MAVTEQEMQAWCEKILAGKAAAPELTLADYIRAIPGLASLEYLPSGSTVLVRGDLDAKPGPQIGDGVGFGTAGAGAGGGRGGRRGRR